MRKVGWYFLAFLAMALFATGAFAQEQVGGIVGTVVDEQNAPLPGATVEALGASGTRFVAVTDEKGAFRFPRLPLDTYTVKVSLSGFQPAEATDVKVVLGKDRTLAFTLKAGFVEAITVTASQVLIDVTKTAVATEFTAEQLGQLPLARDFTSVINLAPGAQVEDAFFGGGGISVDGASSAENRFIVDGIETTHPQDGISGQRLISDFVQEVQVKSAGYAAEYGGALGGVINAVTKTGGNTFSGTFGLRYRTSDWDGSHRPTTRQAFCTDGGPSDPCRATYNKDNEKHWEPTLSLGGPIVKDKLWFFVGYDRNQRDITRTPWVSITDRRPGPRSFDQTITDQYGVVNLKAQVNPSLLLRASYNWSPRKTEDSLPAEDGTTPPEADLNVTLKRPTSSYSLYMDYILGQNFVLSARAGRYETDSKDSGFDAPYRAFFQRYRSGYNPFPGGENDPLWHPSGWSSVPAASFFANNMDKWTRTGASIDGSWYFELGGSHQVKAGLQYAKIENAVDYGEVGNLYIFRWGLSDRFGRGVKGQYGSLEVRRFRTDGSAESNNLGIFLQDSWAPLPNLTINYGVRAEQEKVPTYAGTRYPELGKWAINWSFKDKLAPRFGFSWDVLKNQQLKVYGSYGVYYDIFKLEMPRGSFGGDKWISYLYPLNDYNWPQIISQCQLSTNDPQGNPCPALGTPVRLDLRHPTDPHSAIDPDLKPMENREWQLGAEYALASDMALTARYVNKKLINTIEDIGYLVCEGDVCQEEYITGNPGKGIVGGDPDGSGPIPPQAKAYRDYQALELGFDKRFTDNWWMKATYTYSKLEGNYSGLATSDEPGRVDPNVARYFDGLVYGYDARGRLVKGPLNTDRPHAVEITGSYRFPWNMTATAFYSWRSGSPRTTIAEYNGVDFFPFGRNDMGRGPAISQTDVFFAQDFKVAGFDFQVFLNILNVFDQKKPVRYYTYKWLADICDARDDCDGSNEWYFGTLVPYDPNQVMADMPKDPLYGKPVEWQRPRAFWLGFRVTF